MRLQVANLYSSNYLIGISSNHQTHLRTTGKQPWQSFNQRVWFMLSILRHRERTERELL